MCENLSVWGLPVVGHLDDDVGTAAERLRASGVRGPNVSHSDRLGRWHCRATVHNRLAVLGYNTDMSTTACSGRTRLGVRASFIKRTSRSAFAAPRKGARLLGFRFKPRDLPSTANLHRLERWSGSGPPIYLRRNANSRSKSALAAAFQDFSPDSFGSRAWPAEAFIEVASCSDWRAGT